MARGVAMQPDQAEASSALANLASVSSIRPTACSTSSSLVPKPRLKRTEDSAPSLSRPIALRTCDGSGIPEVQAEPVDAARCGCKALRMSCAENPANRILFGGRTLTPPTQTTSICSTSIGVEYPRRITVPCLAIRAGPTGSSRPLYARPSGPEVTGGGGRGFMCGAVRCDISRLWRPPPRASGKVY